MLQYPFSSHAAISDSRPAYSCWACRQVRIQPNRTLVLSLVNDQRPNRAFINRSLGIWVGYIYGRVKSF